MKYNLQKYLPVLLLMPLLMACCKKWIDVQPDTQIRDDVFFSKESGFSAALNGVYLAMGDPSLYGREMTCGLVEVIGQQYTLRSTFGAQLYIDAQNYLYKQPAVQLLTDSIWHKMYNAIANVNNLIENFEKADTSIFTAGNYSIMKGEGYALRGFLHFDLARLYAPSYQAGRSMPGIPYVTEFRPQIVSRSSVEVVMNKVLDDLKKAEALLHADPLAQVAPAVNVITDRKLKMNLYAVKALLARVYLLMGDKENALAYARQVIDISSQKFPWISRGVVATTSEESRNRIFSSEMIFNLQVTSLATNIRSSNFNLDTSTVGAGGGRSTSLNIVDYTRAYEQYETNATNGGTGGNDLRWLYLVRKYTTGTSNITATFYSKLYQYGGMPSDAARRIPLIRVSEMYYIAAECLLQTDIVAATNYLNQVRAARNLAPLGTTLTPEQLEQEIFKEYRKEFPTEGQMFYYYKRLDKSVIPGATQPFDKSKYVLPLPVAELEFGR